MAFRTFGWVQNPSDFTKLKKTVQVFDPQSKQYEELDKHTINNVIYFDSDKERLQDELDNKVSEFTYEDLVGTSRNKAENLLRSEAMQLLILCYRLPYYRSLLTLKESFIQITGQLMDSFVGQ